MTDVKVSSQNPLQISYVYVILPLLTNHNLNDYVNLILFRAEMAEWQTHTTQNRARETSCGFKSRFRHQIKTKTKPKNRPLSSFCFLTRNVLDLN